MRNRSGKLDMSHALTADFGFCDLNSAAFANLALISDSLIFSAVALPVLRWSENLFTEKTVLFGFECAVVYSFGLFNFAVRPFSDLIGRRKTDFYGFKSDIFHVTRTPFRYLRLIQNLHPKQMNLRNPSEIRRLRHCLLP